MKVYPHVCGVIPPHILSHVAEQPDEASRGDALSTLEHMRELATARVRMTLPTEGTVAPQPTQKKRRNVYDAQHSQKLPGKLVMSEHKPRSADVEVAEAYDGAGATFDFFALVFGRQSIDNRGMRIDSTVHYGSRFDNALWNGREIVYGEATAESSSASPALST
jgi:Zn-dependent metalloprotease